MTSDALSIGLGGLVTSLVATGAVGAWARRRGVLDRPDPTRRTHTVPTPRLGGVGVLVGCLGGVAVAAARGVDARGVAGCAAALGFFAVGLADDVGRRGGLAARTKFASLVLVAALDVVFGGVRFDGTGAAPWPALDFGPVAGPILTVLWFVAVANVINFMDGIDAIAATTCAVLLGLGAMAGAPGLRGLDLAALGATIGFLAWNAPRGRIFLGDGGAYLLGWLVASVACVRGEPAVTAVERAAPWPLVGAALVPSIVDVAEALIHKRRHGVPLLRPHHDHLYQRLVKAGHPAVLVAARYGALAVAAILVAGPLAARAGVVAAAAIGLTILGAHLRLGARSVRAVPRLRATPS